MIKKYNVKVFVESTYLEDHSDPYEDSYLWSYKVIIKNNEKEKIKLISRHWKIFDSNGNFREVKGKGVVGEQPTIEPGDKFEYTSGTPLKTNNGIMQGFYLMSQDNGSQIKIDIPTFSLDSPYNKKNLH